MRRIEFFSVCKLTFTKNDSFDKKKMTDSLNTERYMYGRYRFVCFSVKSLMCRVCGDGTV